MSEGIIIAIIGAAGLILAAIIAKYKKPTIKDKSVVATRLRLVEELNQEKYKQRKFVTLKRVAPGFSDEELRHLLNNIAEPVMVKNVEMWRKK